MIKFNGMRPEESGKRNNNQLPAGPYVCRVLEGRVEGDAPDQRLAVLLDVCEGQYKDFFMKRYTEQKQRYDDGKLQYKPKYKGVIRLRIPNPDNKNAQYPESDGRRFNDMIARFENSNPNVEFFTEAGFDETRLTGKLIGISVQEDEYNGAKFTKPVRFENVEDVRQGLVSVMPPRGEQPDPTNAPMKDQRSGMTVVNTEKLPWDKDDVPY